MELLKCFQANFRFGSLIYRVLKDNFARFMRGLVMLKILKIVSRMLCTTFAAPAGAMRIS